MFTDVGLQSVNLVMQVCPKAPPGAQVHVDNLTGYVLWGVLALFGVACAICIGAIVAGRMFNMPHATTAGIIGLVVIFLAAIGYLIFPGIVDAMLGSGCI